MISYNSIIHVNCNFISSEVDNELFLMSLENNAYYGLEDVGKRIFEIIQKPISFLEIVEILLNEYDIDKETCINDLREFLLNLEKENIIKISN
ncbi:MAG: hypothetical protein KatS3mg068_0847 [Candidatus Sericytochromatia bacterium]|nr:MAG: hypothetical protein KatS3mg068_0847 [Candidatus Sericytochromatia bacterium]